jgi:hypothetical protein
MLARVMAASVQPTRPIQASMQRKLESLSPVVLNIVNESHKHAGHSGRLAEPPTSAAQHQLQPDFSMLYLLCKRTACGCLTVTSICSQSQHRTVVLPACVQSVLPTTLLTQQTAQESSIS